MTSKIHPPSVAIWPLQIRRSSVLAATKTHRKSNNAFERGGSPSIYSLGPYLRSPLLLLLLLTLHNSVSPRTYVLTCHHLDPARTHLRGHHQIPRYNLLINSSVYFGPLKIRATLNPSWRRALSVQIHITNVRDKPNQHVGTLSTCV